MPLSDAPLLLFFRYRPEGQQRYPSTAHPSYVRSFDLAALLSNILQDRQIVGLSLARHSVYALYRSYTREPSIRTRLADGAKAPSRSMQPETHLALRRYACKALVQGPYKVANNSFFAISERSLYCSAHSYECRQKSSVVSANLDSERITAPIPPAHWTLKSSISERYVKTIPRLFLTCKRNFQKFSTFQKFLILRFKSIRLARNFTGPPMSCFLMRALR